MTLNQHTYKISYYKGHFVIEIRKTPKLQNVGTGTLIKNYNNSDVLISYDALNELKKYIGKKSTTPAIEVVNKNTIWIASYTNTIISDKEDICLYDLPICTIVDNDIDINIKNFLDK